MLKRVIGFLIFPAEPVPLRGRQPPERRSRRPLQLDRLFGERRPFVPKAGKRQKYPKPAYIVGVVGIERHRLLRLDPEAVQLALGMISVRQHTLSAGVLRREIHGANRRLQLPVRQMTALLDAGFVRRQSPAVYPLIAYDNGERYPNVGVQGLFLRRGLETVA